MFTQSVFTQGFALQLVCSCLDRAFHAMPAAVLLPVTLVLTCCAPVPAVAAAAAQVRILVLASLLLPVTLALTCCPPVLAAAACYMIADLLRSCPCVCGCCCGCLGSHPGGHRPGGPRYRR
jgi:hypothetical protein